jgi:hypothetical protein
MPSYHWRETAVVLIYSMRYPFSLMRMPLRGPCVLPVPLPLFEPPRLQPLPSLAHPAPGPKPMRDNPPKPCMGPCLKRFDN